MTEEIRMADEDQKQAACERSAQAVLMAYQELARIAHCPQGFLLEDLQGAVEYLLDTVKTANRSGLNFIVPPKDFHTS